MVGRRFLPLILTLSLISIPPSLAALELEPRQLSALATCLSIQGAISSSSSIGWPATSQYLNDIKHWASSSTELSACSVEPGSVDDLSKIIKILGQKRTKFAIKGGGHNANKGFSSTPGVHIAMSRFKQVTYNSAAQTVDIGSGALWDDVYAALEPSGVNVVGGRVSGVGVGGFILGGGYSWLSNQHGLTIDTVQAFDLVLPNGTFTTVTGTSNPDLFFALKGGGNNFGIVTKFTLKAFPQGQVWGGLLTTLGADQIPAVSAATVKFCNTVTDPKAAIITSYVAVASVPATSVNIFYDGPNPPPGIFDDFLAIPAISKDLKTRSFLSLVNGTPSNVTAGLRALFNTGSVLKYTPAVVAQIANQSAFWSHKLLGDTGAYVNFAVESFLPSYFDNSQGGAYPHDPSYPAFPLFTQFSWLLPGNDGAFLDAGKQGLQAIVNTAISEGQNIAGNRQLQYSNYALPGTDLEDLYGDNLPRLKSIKAQYDPGNVMGLAGGFKL